MATGSCCSSGKYLYFQLLPQHLQLFYGSRPVNIRSYQQRPPTCLRRRLASLALVVVLPAPLSPTIMITVGGLGAKLILLLEPP